MTGDIIAVVLIAAAQLGLVGIVLWELEDRRKKGL
jgi:hypothetical protein